MLRPRKLIKLTFRAATASSFIKMNRSIRKAEVVAIVSIQVNYKDIDQPDKTESKRIPSGSENRVSINKNPEISINVRSNTDGPELGRLCM